ncbi:MAG: hypothetical protein WDM81_14955 [Rhizomicrobium sp.]
MICGLISILLVSYLVVCWAFMPLFLTAVRGFSPEAMGLADGGARRFRGRRQLRGERHLRPVRAQAGDDRGLLHGRDPALRRAVLRRPVWILAALFAVGWVLTGLFPLFMGTVPSESVGPHHMATAIAMVMSVGEIVGGVLAPALAAMRLMEWPRRAAVDHDRALPGWGRAGVRPARDGARRCKVIAARILFPRPLDLVFLRA